MTLTPIQHGARFSIFAWEDGDTCPLLELLEELMRDANSDAERIRYLMKRTAEQGTPQNPHQCKHLAGDIHEFKAGNGTRVLWFYHEDKIIICTHGFVKKKQKTPREEIKRANRIKEQITEADLKQAQARRHKYLKGSNDE